MTLATVTKQDEMGLAFSYGYLVPNKRGVPTKRAGWGDFFVYSICRKQWAGWTNFQKKTINGPCPSIRHLRVGRNKRTFGKGKLRPRDRRQASASLKKPQQGALMTIHVLSAF